MGCAQSELKVVRSVDIQADGVERDAAGCTPTYTGHHASSAGDLDHAGSSQLSNRFSHRRFHEEYVLHHKLGCGAFAAVYCCQPVEGDPQMLAAKVADLRTAGSKGSYDNAAIEVKRHRAMTREVRMLSMVQGNENVIKIAESFVEGGLAYLVMEMCDRTLLQVLERTRVWTEDTIKPIFQGMLKGLVWVHHCGVVHRDVKPDNFMCKGPTDTIKLCDFGLSCELTGSEGVVGINGTPPFMAPEMLKSHRYGPKVDVWSFGVLGYTLVFGHFPYTPVEPNGPAMKAAILAGNPAPTFRQLHSSSRVPVAHQGDRAPSQTCVRFLQDMLCRDPVRRPTSKDALAYDFFRVVACPEANPRDSLRPMLHMAKRCGAFDQPQAAKSEAKTEVDARLRFLQESVRPTPCDVKPQVFSQNSEISTEVGSEGTRMMPTTSKNSKVTCESRQ
uniref:Protein kinase domain-containing protein n=1 Tax=Zooxanthella nutricula TaxID=1333877 RepID=A0A7S2K9P4_9DINO